MCLTDCVDASVGKREGSEVDLSALIVLLDRAERAGGESEPELGVYAVSIGLWEVEGMSPVS